MSETVNKHFSTIKTRSIIEPDKMYTKFPKLACVPQALKMDFSRILNKPYYIATIPWATTTLKGLDLITASGGVFANGFSVPDSIFLNALSKIPFQSSTLYRGKVRLIFQIAGTPMHQGAVIFAAQPAGFVQPSGVILSNRYNSLMAGPHVFGFANESTAVSLEVPFYFNTKLGKTDLDNSTIQPNYSFGNYAQIVAAVLNPLEGPSGASTSLSFSIHAEFTEMEFYGPHVDVTFQPAPTLLAQGLLDDFKRLGTGVIDTAFSTAGSLTKDILDRGRGMVRAYTGLDAHNEPNLVSKQHVVSRQHANLVDMPKQFEKMDPYGEYDRICDDYIFDTERDEMLMREIITKPQLIGTFNVNAADTTGTLCWAHPISPVSQNNIVRYTNTEGVDVQTTSWDNLFQTMYALTRYWRGSIKIHIQSVMSNFHYCKLLVAKDYSVRKLGLTQYPTFGSVPNLLTDTLEFSAGGQVQTIELPYISPLEVQPNTLHWDLIASQLGMYYIYLAQPLVVNGTVVSSVKFNVYISAGDDFSFYGYAQNPLRLIVPFDTAEPPADELTEEVSLSDESADAILVAQGDSSVMDAKVPEPVGLQKEVTFSEAPQVIPYDTSIMRPIVSIRDLMRRMYLVEKIKLQPDQLFNESGILLFDLAKMLGLRSMPNTLTQGTRSCDASTLRILQNMFHGYSGGARIKMVISGASKATAWYIPPGFMVQSPNQAQTTGGQLWMSNTPIPISSDQILAVHQLFSPVPYLTGGQEYSIQSVTQEVPNLAVNSLAADALYAGDAHFAASYCELEMEIPNCSPYRFVGDYVSKVGAGLVVLNNTPTTNMGYIALHVPQQYSLKEEIDFSGIQVSIYLSTDDVARNGYQVHSPPVMRPAAIVGGGAPQPNFSFVGTDYSPSGTAQMSSIPTNPILLYIKT